MVVLDDETDFIGGLNLGESLAYLMSWDPDEKPPKWVDRFLVEVS